MEQIERIQEMESCLDASEKAIRELSEALSAFEEVQPQYGKLSDYYGSDRWLQDFLPRRLRTCLRRRYPQSGVLPLRPVFCRSLRRSGVLRR